MIHRLTHIWWKYDVINGHDVDDESKYNPSILNTAQLVKRHFEEVIYTNLKHKIESIFSIFAKWARAMYNRSTILKTIPHK